MDLQNGAFLNWPLGPYWDENADLLDLMHLTWQTWRYCLNTADPKHQWTNSDINFDTWLNEGRPNLIIPSDYEQWLAGQNENNNG